MTRMHSNQETQERALLFSLATSSEQLDKEVLPSLQELEALTRSCGAEVLGWVTQIRPHRDPALYLGKGKIEELKALTQDQEVDLLICDEELSGAQIRNLENYTGARVLDRTFVILDIFAQRARSREGRLQVELAQQKYRLSRLVQQNGLSLSRQGGGIGTRGPGESKLETDRRHIRRRLDALTEELKQLSKQRNQARAARKREGRVQIAVVGYTNAGKSTLLNRLCKADVLAENQLFATLDPSIRALQYTTEDAYKRVGRARLPYTLALVDTVGLIRRLPHTLIHAFESTLREAAEADALLLVLDCSDPDAVEQLRVTEQVLEELGAGALPTFCVLNQMDKEEAEEQKGALLEAFHRNHPGEENLVFCVSARTGSGLEELKDSLLDWSLQLRTSSGNTSPGI